MEKEQRRRKIISRGTDRMALITGRIQTLDPDPFSKSSSFSTSRRDNPPAQHARSSSEPGAAHEEALFLVDHSHGGDDVLDTITQNDNNEEVSKGDDPITRVYHLPKIEEKRAPRSPLNANSNPPQNSLGYFLSSITLNEINFSIISSEDTRVICAVVLALLVILSHINLPNNGTKRKSLILYRPLFVVLLTDVFIVARKLAPYAQIRKEDKNTRVEEDGDNWGGAFKLLELGLVLHQTIRAIFIDCSFYLVIVVCGLSLMSRS